MDTSVHACECECECVWSDGLFSDYKNFISGSTTLNGRRISFKESPGRLKFNPRSANNPLIFCVHLKRCRPGFSFQWLSFLPLAPTHPSLPLYSPRIKQRRDPLWNVPAAPLVDSLPWREGGPRNRASGWIN